MKHIFVSSIMIDAPPADALVKRLRQDGFVVAHSPVKDDTVVWGDWYERGCRAELNKSEVFISVITPSWDCSTWMQHELFEARRCLESGKTQRVCYYNPTHVRVRENVAEAYLKDKLPDNLDDVIMEMRLR